jgi:hypothetical protein
MRQNVYKRLEQMERIYAAARQAEAHRNGPSGAEVMRALLSRCAIEQLPGESRAETLARAAGISTRELKDFLWERAHAAGPESERTTEGSMRRW